MELDEKTIRKIAKLARIELKDGEIGKYAAELSGILSWMEQLQEVNTDDIPQMAGVGDYTQRLREDIVSMENSRDDVLENAPESQFGCYVVPKVVE